jgi:hypothetical protein
MWGPLVLAALLSGTSAPRQAVDLDGGPADPIGAPGVTVLVFVRTDCPVSNRYAPELNRLHAKFAPRGAGFWLVYPDPREDASAVRAHVREYGYAMGALRDPAHDLVARARARITPEAAVFAGARLVYHGRIDDRQIDFGRTRPAPTTHELEEAIEAALGHRPPPRDSAPAVGCFIADLR